MPDGSAHRDVTFWCVRGSGRVVQLGCAGAAGGVAFVLGPGRAPVMHSVARRREVLPPRALRLRSAALDAGGRSGRWIDEGGQPGLRGGSIYVTSEWSRDWFARRESHGVRG